ncbi:hypothetical protein RFI_08154 [Reticulomyxa filosa]|uniref:Uncharacterized protein n=1 Tax=Reticulomyxa filosa TaxID=46433 RepID=X6NSR2_RETFI|nr:hypothetical protein RFI_08154 [Reticulomyxa filosa]|eukprot:ETO28968.1 hypothetical protein RFI_08154 [Reticulomyxa filosa]
MTFPLNLTFVYGVILGIVFMDLRVDHHFIGVESARSLNDLSRGYVYYADISANESIYFQLVLPCLIVVSGVFLMKLWIEKRTQIEFFLVFFNVFMVYVFIGSVIPQITKLKSMTLKSIADNTSQQDVMFKILKDIALSHVQVCLAAFFSLLIVLKSYLNDSSTEQIEQEEIEEKKENDKKTK